MLRWLIVIAVAVLVWWLVVRPADCVIRFKAGRIHVRGRFTAGLQQRLEHFLLTEFTAERRLRIEINYPRAARPLRIRVRGRLSPGERQMIRNFLLIEL
jgi:hypothetical protein